MEVDECKWKCNKSPAGYSCTRVSYKSRFKFPGPGFQLSHAGIRKMQKETDTQKDLWMLLCYSGLKLLICLLNLCICTKLCPETSLPVWISVTSLSMELKMTSASAQTYKAKLSRCSSITAGSSFTKQYSGWSYFAYIYIIFLPFSVSSISSSHLGIWLLSGSLFGKHTGLLANCKLNPLLAA